MAWRNPFSMDPFREVQKLQRNVERLMDEMVPEGFGEFGSTSSEWGFRPACEVSEHDNQYLLSFDLPGVSKDDIHVKVKNNQLIVSGERKRSHEEERHGVTTREKSYGNFMRSFSLPAEIHAKDVKASYEDGVLEIAIPKTESDREQFIAIREGRLLGGPGQVAVQGAKKAKEVA